jgi:hypothetical protein
MIQLSDSEKTIYNLYLKHSRKGQGYRLRKDFSDLDQDICTSVAKITKFLKAYSHIDWNEFFESYGELHPNEKYPNINFFTSRLAIKNYSLYKKQKESRDPEKQFDEIKSSMRFIGLFCIENEIELKKYLFHKTGYMYSWLNHYREHRINPYALMELGDIVSILDSIENDVKLLFASNLDKNLIAFKTRYQNSNKTKNYVKELTTTIEKFVKKELTNSK